MDEKTKDAANLVSGNTVKITNQFGPILVYFDANGSYTAVGMLGTPSHGIWRAADSEVCITSDGQSKENCLSFKGRSIGDIWTAEDPRNGNITYELLRGRHAFSGIKKPGELPTK